jgi:hypothetical protein
MGVQEDGFYDFQLIGMTNQRHIFVILLQWLESWVMKFLPFKWCVHWFLSK